MERASIDKNELKARRSRLAKLLAKIETAIQRPAYLRRRKANRLAGDIAFLAILMAKARADGLLDEQSYRTQAMQFWRVLCFSPKGNNGLILSFLAELDGEARSDFTTEMRSTRLSAAMALWCTFDWAGAESDAQKFRFSAALLAARYRWLAEGGDQASMTEEPQRLTGKLFPASRQEDLIDARIRWVRDGYTVATLHSRLSVQPQGELASYCTRTSLRAGELTWQTKRGLCFLAQDVTRTPKGKAELMPADGSDRVLVQSSFVAPLIEILKSDIDLSEHVKRQAFDLLVGSHREQAS